MSVDISDFLQMRQMNPEPTPGPAPQPPGNVPHGTNFNILERGADTAINTARQALGARRHPARPLVRLFSDAISGSMMASDHPGMQAMGKAGFDPYAEQDAQTKQNMEIANYLQKAEEARKHHLIQQQHQILQQQQFEESKRHNQASEGISRDSYLAKYGAGHGHSPIVKIDGQPVDLSQFELAPIEGKPHINKLQGYKATYGNAMHLIDGALKKLDKVEELTKDDWFKPTDRIMGKAASNSIDIRASGGDEKAIAKRNSFKVLRDSLATFRSFIEDAKRNGKVGVAMIERFEREGLLAHENDSASTIRAKLEAIKEEIAHGREAAELSIKSHQNIDPYDLIQIKQTLKEQAIASGTLKVSNTPLDKMTKSAKVKELEELRAAKAAQGQQ